MSVCQEAPLQGRLDSGVPYSQEPDESTASPRYQWECKDCQARGIVKSERKCYTTY